MKQPPSQRPERQGPTRWLEVGKPYNPDRKSWPQGSNFNYRGGELELLLFFDSPTPAEVEVVKSGRADFGLYDRDGLVVLCYRFVHAKGGVPWSDAPYHCRLVPARDRIAPPDSSPLSLESRAILHIVLVNATGGQIRALRAVSFSPEMTRSLFAAIVGQTAGPWDARRYDSDLKALYFQYPTADQLAGACSVHCEGGA